MDALFIGQAYIDVTFITDHIPTGDDKYVARDYAVAFGGNAVTAAFCCAKLGIKPDLLATNADDWLGQMFRDMSSRYGIALHTRKVRESSLSLVIPNGTKRAIVRCRDDDYLHPYPNLYLTGCRGVHVDGHQPDAAAHYCKLAREQGILTSLDGGGVRTNTHELLELIDVAVVSERFREQLDLDHAGMLDLLKAKGCRIGAITQGEKGMIWYDETGERRHMPALPISPDKVVDTNGAGDVYHGAYMYAAMANPDGAWEDHFAFARAASAHAIQHLGNEASLPSLADVEAMQSNYAKAA